MSVYVVQKSVVNTAFEVLILAPLVHIKNFIKMKASVFETTS